MAQQSVAVTAVRGRDARGITVPDVVMRFSGAMLALAVAAVHVADQGGVTAFASPDLLSRSVGVPGDPGDVGNWGYWVGTVSLLVEAGLVALSISMLPALRRDARARSNSSSRTGRPG
jgi:hypothetical protein